MVSSSLSLNKPITFTLDLFLLLKHIEKITRKLGANTTGEGGRFHSDNVWKTLFKFSGFKIIN